MQIVVSAFLIIFTFCPPTGMLKKNTIIIKTSNLGVLINFLLETFYELQHVLFWIKTNNNSLTALGLLLLLLKDLTFVCCLLSKVAPPTMRMTFCKNVLSQMCVFFRSNQPPPPDRDLFTCFQQPAGWGCSGMCGGPMAPLGCHSAVHPSSSPESLFIIIELHSWQPIKQDILFLTTCSSPLLRPILRHQSFSVTGAPKSFLTAL